VLQPDSFNNPPYNDESRWICFKLNYPGTVDDDYGYCFGYVELNSDVATEMIQPLRRNAENGNRALNATVRLRFSPDAKGTNQVTIEKFHDGWIHPHAK
jgi:hypothetical protein